MISGLNVAQKGLKIKNSLIKFMKLSRKRSWYPKDLIVRGKYHRLKRDYKRLVKYKEHSFHETMLQRISQLESNDPTTFWEMVKKLKTHRDENLTDNIDPLEWQEWFKKLNKPQSTPCGTDKIIDSIIKKQKILPHLMIY